MPKQTEVVYTEKKSYSFKPATLNKLKELKVYAYTNVKYNQILDEAINLLYRKKTNKDQCNE